MRHKPTIRHFIVDVLQSAMQVFLLFIIFTSLIGRFEIRQTSMEPTFHEGQRVMVSQLGSVLPELSGRTAYAATGSERTTSVLRRQQVVVLYDMPKRTGDPLIKRLIALPGETIEIRDGEVLINDKELDEPYINGTFTSCNKYCGPLTLDEEEYFFMGDNRAVSRDSRNFGPVPASQIVGPVVVRYWPLNDFSLDL
jgi:signal peptidase I